MQKIAIIILAIVSFLGFGLWLLSAQSASKPDLEAFLRKNNASSEIAEAYRFAQENPQGILSVVKCYCGCLKNGSGHKNNLDCFFNDDGSIDLMSLNCGLCVKTALTAKQMLAEGKSVQEIAEFVDNRWGKSLN